MRAGRCLRCIGELMEPPQGQARSKACTSTSSMQPPIECRRHSAQTLLQHRLHTWLYAWTNADYARRHHHSPETAQSRSEVRMLPSPGPALQGHRKVTPSAHLALIGSQTSYRACASARHIQGCEMSRLPTALSTHRPCLCCLIISAGGHAPVYPFLPILRRAFG